MRPGLYVVKNLDSPDVGSKWVQNMIFRSVKCRSKNEIFADDCDLELSGLVIWAGSAAEAGVLEAWNLAEL